MSETTDRDRSCAYCGRSLPRRHAGTLSRYGNECETCASGKPAMVAEPPDPIHSRPQGGYYPRLSTTPEELEKYRALTAAFDAEQMDEAAEFYVPLEEREIEEMPIIAKETGSNFKPAPAGVSAAVGCDVIDLGMVKTSYPGRPDTVKHKVRVVWQLADVDEAIGQRPIVSQRYTLSLHEKAALRRDLESWRGRTFTPAELHGFDVEKVIGVPCMLNIVHNVSKGVTYANVSAIMPIPKGMPKPIVEGYVREKDRPKEAPAGGVEPGDDDGYGDPSLDNEFAASDADVPFAVVLPFLAGLVGFGSLIV